MSKVLNIHTDSFAEDVLKSPVPVLVDFWAPWCMPRRMMIPTLDEVAEEIGDKAKVIKVDINDSRNAELARLFEIMSIPSLKVFKGGKVVDEFIGVQPKGSLVDALAKAA